MRFNSVTDGPSDTDHLHAREPKGLFVVHTVTLVGAGRAAVLKMEIFALPASDAFADTPANQPTPRPPADAGNTPCCVFLDSGEIWAAAAASTPGLGEDAQSGEKR